MNKKPFTEMLPEEKAQHIEKLKDEWLLIKDDSTNSIVKDACDKAFVKAKLNTPDPLITSKVRDFVGGTHISPADGTIPC